MLFVYFTAQDSGSLDKSNTGIGNVLFQLSFQYSICKKYGIVANYHYLCTFLEKLKTFGLLDYEKTIFRNFKLDDKYIVQEVCLQETQQAHIYDPHIINQIVQNKDKHILIKNSYLQSLEYFKEYSDEICNLFLPDENSLAKIHLKYPQLSDKEVTTISIHIRFNWGLNVSYVNKYFIDSLNYLITSQKLKTNNICILVFSDDINRSKKLLVDLKENIIYCENNLDYIDLWIMSLCKHNIICHSTLGWWGAYLNKNLNKVVIYPRDMLTFYSNLTGKDIKLLENNHIPNDWICLNSNAMKY